jgi:hypothetical protein
MITRMCNTEMDETERERAGVGTKEAPPDDGDSGPPRPRKKKIGATLRHELKIAGIDRTSVHSPRDMFGE